VEVPEYVRHIVGICGQLINILFFQNNKNRALYPITIIYLETFEITESQLVFAINQVEIGAPMSEVYR